MKNTAGKTQNNTMTRDAKILNPRTIPLIIALVLIAGFIGYQFFMWQTTTVYLDRADKVIAKANVQITKYNRLFAAFQGDPESAKKLAPEFAKAEKSVGKFAADIEGIKAPAKAEMYHRDLIMMYKDSGAFYRDLGTLAAYIVERNAILEQFAKDTETFSNSIGAGQTDADVLAASVAMKTAADKAFADLEALKRPRLDVYSNRALEDNLSAVSAALASMHDGINNNNVTTLQSSAVALQAAFARNWSEAMFEADSNGLKQFEVRATKLQRMLAKLSLERSRL